MVYKVTIAIFLLLLTTGSTGQSYYFRHLQVENGLSNNAVICSIQDKKGFVWFGTKDGLDRFDGYTFKIFRNDPGEKGSIGSNFIHCLYEDLSGTLWVGTENRLYSFDPTTENFTLLPDTAGGQIRDIQMDKTGNLWFISGFTLAKYNMTKRTMEYFNTTEYFEATSLCITGDGSLWVSGSSGSLNRYNPVTNTFTAYDLFTHSPKTVSQWIEKIYPAAGNTILTGTSNQGAKLFDINTGTYKDILTYNNDRTEIFVRNFIQTAEKEYWIATESGIFIYNLATGVTANLCKKYNDPYSISDNAVYTFCRDKEGGIWAGTYFGGVNYYPKHLLSFTKYFPKTGENSLGGNVVREIRKDNNGNVWIGTEDAGLNKLDTNGVFTRFQPTGKKGSLSYMNIHGLLVTGNELWIGTFEHGLDVMDIRTGKVIRHYSKGSGANSLKSNFIYCITQSANGEIMLGTTVGAYAYDRVADNFRLLPGMPIFNWYSAILRDHQGRIWAGTYGNGVNFYDPQTNTSRKFRYDPLNKNSLCSDRINSIFEDSDKNLWFATEGGLCRFEPGSGGFERYTTANGLPTNFTLSVLEDADHNLWISTSRGLVCFTPKTGHIKVYTRANGLLNDQFNFSSAFKDNDNTMYFGSVKGLVSFNPRGLTRNDFTPVVYLTGFQVNNTELTIAQKNSPLKKSITYTDQLQLSYNQSTFSIDFASLSYSAPDMSEYAYKMEGLGTGWTYLKKNRKVYFTELSPGTYTFKVKAANSNGEWSGPETTLAVQILPPWWASHVAYTIYGVVIIGITWFAFRIYHQRLREKNRRKIEQLEIASEKELYEAKMQFFTNVAHEIKTPLTLIKGPLEKVMRKAGDMPEIKDSLRIMEKNTTRLVDLTNQLLDFRETEINGFSLNFVKANISELLEDTWFGFKPLAEQKNLTFTIAPLPATLYALVDIEAFNKILANLFSNAVKYAKSKVEVMLLPVKEGDTFFTIEIKNDGYLIPYHMKDKIFEPFFRLKETEKQKGTGIGLALSRSLAELQKGILDVRRSENDMNIFFLSMPVHLAKEEEIPGESNTSATNNKQVLTNITRKL